MNSLNYSPSIPMPVRIFTCLLICAGCFFFYVYTFNPSLSFPNAVLDSYSSRMGFGSAGVRILGSVFALILSLLAKDARWLFITLISRVFIELGDVVLGITLDGITSNTYGLIVLASAEIWATGMLWKALNKNQ